MDSAAVICMIRSLHAEGVEIVLSLMLSDLPNGNMHECPILPAPW